jgi:hypothetical protein
MVQFDSTQNVCPKCDAVHTSIDCPVCFPGRFAVAVDKLFGFHRPLPFVAALMAGMALAGSAVGQRASSAVYVPPSSFQVVEIGARSEAVGWPHRFTAAEARGMSREATRAFRREYRPVTTYPSHKRAVKAACSTNGRGFTCRLVDGRGRAVVYVGVDRVWEDGSVRVVWPQAPSIR